MANTLAKDKIAISVYFPKKYYAKLKRAAKKQNKSISQLMTNSVILLNNLDHELINDTEPNIKYVVCEEADY